ncbi:MAG: YkgJ family cysteine cluster protein [Gammaproteobacteria bacterium]
MKDCNQCGKCCTNYGGNGGLSASTDDIAQWRKHRPDIARYVRGNDIWFDPHSGEQLDRCPWLRRDDNAGRYTCDIYADRPEDCRFYPVRIEQMIQDDCEMLEPQDLLRRRHAQKTLDTLMADSRPACR